MLLFESPWPRHGPGVASCCRPRKTGVTHDQSLRTQSNDSMLGGPAAPLPFERTLAKRGPARKNSPRLARHGLAARGIRAIFFFAADFIVITAILHRT